MNVMTDHPFGDVVRMYAARSHDIDWVSAGKDAAWCVYCGATARDLRPLGLPWVNMTATGSLVLACEGPTMYADDAS